MKKSKRIFTLMITLFMLSSIITLQPAYGATSSPVVNTLLPASIRLAGYDRFDTSIAISQKMFPTDSSFSSSMGPNTRNNTILLE